MIIKKERESDIHSVAKCVNNVNYYWNCVTTLR